MTAAASVDLPPLDGWVPVRVARQTPEVAWCHVGRRRFTEPFFEQTIARCLGEAPFSLLFQHYTPLAALTAWAAVRPGLTPSGFIFHLSRCGSTLVAQMLAALPQHIVISEAPPIDAILRAPFAAGASDAQRGTWLRGMLSAFGQRRTGAERHFFVKFDSSHTLALPLIRRAFPETPWIFLCREPLAVLVSQLRRPAAHCVPGMLDWRLPGTDLAAVDALMSTEEYAARVLGGICAAALAALRCSADGGSRGRVVHYRELPEAVDTTLREHFRLADFTAAELDRMRSVAAFDAKEPSRPFSADAAEKQRAATPLLREMCARWVEPVYAQLAALRRADAAAGTLS